MPTPKPSSLPTPAPSPPPTTMPTSAPTPVPSLNPTVKPSSVPTVQPTLAPTYLPGAPTARPTLVPTPSPSPKPTASSLPTVAFLSTDPKILSWVLDLSLGRIDVTLSSAVNAETFKPSRLSIISSQTVSYPFDSAVYITGYRESSFMGRDIEDAYDPKQNYTSVYFYVLDDDYSALMYNPTTANNAGNSFLVARQGAFTTRSGRPSQEINQNAALQAELVIPDTVPPSLLSGGIDYNLGLITLIFSEPIGNGGVATGDITLDGLGMQSAADCGQYGSAYQCKVT